MTLKIDFLSDLHMEINPNPRLLWPKEPGNVLILGGDTTCYRFFDPRRTDADSRSMRKRFDRLMEFTFNHYERVLYLPGNHEYYGYTFIGADEEFSKRTLTANWCMQVVNNDVIVIDDVVIICATLWTDFDNHNPMTMLAVTEAMNDFRVIQYKRDEDVTYQDRHQFGGTYRNRLTGLQVLDEHIKSVAFIQAAIKTYPDKKIVVVTHHCPSLQSHSVHRFGDTTLKFGYCSSLEPMILDSRILYWIHGHTHYNVNYMIGDCNVISSMYGYDGYDRHRGSPKHEIGRIEI